MFKDGKYRFQPISLTYFMPGDKNYSSQTISVPLTNLNTKIFKKNGKIRSEFKNTPLEISNIFNELNISLKSHLLNNNKNDTW